MDIFWHSWLWVAFTVPIFYALDCVFDVFFIGKNVYRNPIHATIISGLFSVIYLLYLLADHTSLIFPAVKIILFSIANGMLYLLFIYFYFKALFKLNDVSNLECYLGFSVLLVPVLAFIILGERLTHYQYLGMGVALIGVVVLIISSSAKGVLITSLVTMASAVVLLSLTYVIQDEIFKHANFNTTMMLFSLGQFFAALVLWSVTKCKYVVSDISSSGGLFVFSHLLGVIAVVFSQRAIDISPSVSYVAVIESTTPLFVMFFSIISIFLLSHYSNRTKQSILVFKLQLRKVRIKLLAFACLLTGIIITTATDNSGTLWPL